jgi:hypothetical protein
MPEAFPLFDLSRIDFHRRHPDVSLQKHVRDKRCQLGAAVTSTQRIYLDLRFWLLFRDVSLGRSRDKTLSDLLDILRALVSEGRAICPISESVFIELLKQSDESTRCATAQLIDDLSLGVTLIPFDDRVRQELCNSFYEQAGANNLIPLQQLVWTKLAYVLGEIHPSNTPFPPQEELVIQKAFSDHIWNISLVEMVGYMNKPLPPFDWDALAARLNAGNRAHYSMIRSYTQAFRTEFEGGLSLFRGEMDMLAKELDERGYSDFGTKLAHLSPKTRFEIFSQSIPSLHINATCHAAVRWDQKRNLRGNDLFDFHHAHAALAYCDVFLTERPLASMLSQRHLGLSKYKCRTFWSPDVALSWLRGETGAHHNS